MKIVEIRALRGPNVFHSEPILVMKVDLEDLADTASTDLPGFSEKLLEWLPGLRDHHCSPGRPGGFVERLHRGTYMAHIIEHVALDLSQLAGMDVTYGKTRYAGTYGVYDIAVRYLNEDAMKLLLNEALVLVEAAIISTRARRVPSSSTAADFSPDKVEKILREARALREDTDLGPSSKAIIEAAERRGIPWRRLGEGSLVQLGTGCYVRRVQTAVTDETNLIAADLVQNKELTKRLLRDAAIPCPHGITARDKDEVREGLKSVRAPWVVKPVDGHHGEGVFIGLHTEDEVLAACQRAWDYSSEVLIESYCAGRDYRILLVGGRFTAAAERTPAHVVGDGRSTVQELVDLANRDPRRGEGHSAILTRIEIDESVESFLTQQGWNLAAVPPEGQRVYLRRTANLSTGGTARDVTDEAHESVRQLCERIARIVDLDICGIDLIHYDIRLPVNHDTAVIEVNAGPGLRMHIAPSEGQARDVGGAIIDQLYPPGSRSRVPLVSITGTNGKTTVARLVAHIATTAGHVTGFTCSDGIWIGGVNVDQGDTTGPASARLVLSDPAVEFAVLETARGGLMRSGLGYDWSDVGVITNITADHLGQDGIEDIHDLIHIKSLIAERVRDGGTVVLNADDFESSRLMESAGLSRKRRRVVYYSLDADHPVIQRHLREGGTAYVQKRGWLCEVTADHDDLMIERIVKVSDLTFAARGTAAFNVSNALAAMAAARATGIDQDRIAQGLLTFRAGLHNAGRSNVYQVRDGFVVLDYGHNPEAISSIGHMVQSWGLGRLTAVLGLPGDRSDHLLEDCARVAAECFESIVLRDDSDLRGRVPGEVPELVAKVIRAEFPDVQLQTVLDDRGAIEHALSRIQANEVVVVFYDEYDLAAAALRAYDPIPLDEVPIRSRSVIQSEATSHHSVVESPESHVLPESPRA